jgi:hypothetical protein
MAENFSYKFVAENKPLSFDFNPVLTSGETLSTSSCSVIVLDGTDASPSSLLDGSTSISANKVYQQVQGGVAGVTYRLIVTTTTSANNVYVAIGDLPVYSPSEVE